MMIKIQGILSILFNLGCDFAGAKVFVVTHLNNPNLYISFETEWLLMDQVSGAFVKNRKKLVVPHSNLFHKL